MGFSMAGASVVLFAGLLFVTSTTANAFFEAQRAYADAIEDERTRETLRRTTDVSVLSGGHDSDATFYLNVTNDGDGVLDITRLGLFLDGVWAIPRVTSKTIEGRVTDLWAPGEVLRLEVAAATEPSRAYLIIETGQGVLWTPGGA